MVARDGSILRVDKVTACSHTTTIRLGHYALPEKSQRITERIVKLKKHNAAYIINNGEYELAMIPVEGWDSLQFVRATGLHPEANTCEVIDAVATIPANSSSKTLSMLQLFKKGEFTNRELIRAAASINPK